MTLRRLLELARRFVGVGALLLAFFGLPLGLPWSRYEYRPLGGVLGDEHLGVPGDVHRSDEHCTALGPTSALGPALRSSDCISALIGASDCISAPISPLISLISVPAVGGTRPDLDERRDEETERDRELQLESARLIRARVRGRATP